MTPGASWDSLSTPLPICCGKQASWRRRKPSTARRLRSGKGFPTTIPPSPNFVATLG